MAVTISFPAANITVDLSASTITAVDGSTYGSPLRNTLGVYLSIYKVDYAGSRTLLTTTGNNANPQTDTQWVCSYSTDGWYKFFYVGVPNYAGGTPYAQYDAAYDNVNKRVYRSKSAGNIGNALVNTTFWELISDPASLVLNIGTSTASVNLNTITSIANLNVGLYPTTKVKFGDQCGLAFLEASSTYKRSQDVRNYELLGLAVDDMKECDSRQQYSLLEITARRASALIAQL